jgi:hypothetical protein
LSLIEIHALKDLRAEFASDFDGYVDNLLAPEKRATSPSSSDIINGFSLGSDNHYNEFQSDSSLKSLSAFESRSPCLAKSSANGLDLTLSATKTASPLVLMSVLNSLDYQFPDSFLHLYN